MPRILAVSALVLTLVSGCMPMIRTPIVEPEQATFEGMASTLARQDHRPLTVIWLHGMCSHFDDWADRSARQVEKLLHARLGDGTDVDVPGSGIHIRRFELTAGRHTANLNYVIWSPLAMGRKRDRLCFDSEYRWIKDDPTLSRVCTTTSQTGYFPHARAALNGALKATLMNDCLADAVFYAGANGKVVRDAIRKALCVALTANADCMGDLVEGDIALISESLGSRVLFDSVVCTDAADGQAEVAGRRRSRLLEAFSRVTHFYLLANQLPILDLANGSGICPDPSEAAALAKDMPAASTSSLAVFFRTLRRERQKQAIGQRADFGKVVVVAFTDPNDLLSYRLIAEKDLPQNSDVRLVNVLDSNAGTLLGAVEHPDHAHRRYRKNTDVMRLLVCGHSPTVKPDLCR